MMMSSLANGLSTGVIFQVSNFNLYSLGKKLDLHTYLISEKFEPTENWLPPGYTVSQDYQPIDGLYASL